MSNIRLFFEESLSLNLQSQLNRSQSHYLSKVMRLGSGQKFSLFNESGEWVAKVDDINKGIVEFTIQKKLRSAENDKEIWLAFTPIKLNYLNLMIQKATELGITRFIPILTERTVVRKLNEKRINKIIAEASEQSNRLNHQNSHRREKRWQTEGEKRRMAYLQSNIPYFKAWVRREYTCNFERYHGEFLHAMVVAVTSMPKRTLSFQVIFTG